MTSVLIGAEFGRSSVENHFEGFISEARIWNRALSTDEAQHVFAGGNNPKLTQLTRGLLAHWRPIDATEQADGRLMLFNSVASRAHHTCCADAVLKRNVSAHPLEITLRAGVRAVLVELGAITPLTVQWRRAIDMVSLRDAYKHYCYLGTSVALQKSLLQALDLHTHRLIVGQLGRLEDHADHALKKLHAELRQKLVDVRGRGSEAPRCRRDMPPRCRRDAAAMPPR